MDFGSDFAVLAEDDAAPVAASAPAAAASEAASIPAAEASAVPAPAPPAAPADADPFVAFAAAAPPAARLARAAPGGGRPFGRPLTNVLRLDLGTLGEAAGGIATGDPVFCGSCHSVLSHLSVVKPAASGAADTYYWACEYCGHANTDVLLDEPELPKNLPPAATGIDYLIEPAPAGDHLIEPAPAGDGDAAAGSPSAPVADASNVVFVLDLSGSMCVSEALASNVARKLKGDRRDELARLHAEGDAEDQYLPGERRGVTYVSRMQALQAAVAQQVESLAFTKPSRRVGLVTFASDVALLGDCSGDARVLAGARLTDWETVRAAGAGAVLASPVSACHEALVRKVYSLTEEGSTALGPAVLAAVAMAGGAAGSKVVVCTDGMSNIGLGSLEAPDLPRGTPEPEVQAAVAAAQAAADAFYDRVAALATELGVTVDVLGFEGSGCNLEALGRLASATHGEVTRVSVANILEKFGDVLDEEVVATGCHVTFTAHQCLALRDPTAPDAIPPMPAYADMPASPMPEAAAAAPLGGGGGGGAAAPRPAPVPRYVRLLRSKRAAAPSPAAAAAAAPAPAAAAAGGAAARAAAAEAEAPTEDAGPDAASVGGGGGGGGAANNHAASQLSVVVGQVTRDTEVTLEYSQKPGARAAGVASLPFQVAIEFKRLDGARMLRVLSNAQRVTRDEAQAAASCRPETIMSHAAKSSAALAQRGLYRASVQAAAAYQGLVGRSRAAHDSPAVAMWSAEMDGLRGALEAEIRSDRAAGRGMASLAAAPMREGRRLLGAGGAGRPPVPARAMAVGAPAPAGGMLARAAAAVGGFFGGGGGSARAASAAHSAPMSMALSADSADGYSPYAAAADDEDEEAEVEREVMEAASLSAARRTRRAGDDAMSAQLYSMAKGGKKYSRMATPAARPASGAGGGGGGARAAPAAGAAPTPAFAASGAVFAAPEWFARSGSAGSGRSL